MKYLERTLPTAAENLALDETLLLEAEAGRMGELLRVWEWPSPAVVLGAACRLAEDVNADTCAADEVPILRRSSGGGTVLLGTGCLCFSLVLAYDRSPALGEITSSYEYILEGVRAALAGLVPSIERAGVSDLAVAGRKFSGNAQQRKRHFLLHHGTLLYDFDLSRIGRYLRMPERVPAYRVGREHGEFLMNLPAAGRAIQQHLRDAWQAGVDLDVWPRQEAAALSKEKYTQPDWTQRR